MTILSAVGKIASNQVAFNASLVAFSASVKEDVNEVRDTIALEAWSGCTTLTPVDTGRAAYSWNFNYGSINPTVPPEGNYGKPPKPVTLGLSAPFVAVFITSSLKYIIPLEEGWSKKSERMVEKTLYDLTLRMNSLTGGN
jgi:hypothetical protein